MRTLVIVSSASAPPCIQSTFARLRPYAPLVTMPPGIVPRTKRSRYAKPNLPRSGARLPR
jgi:hypothetical protein